MQPHIRMLTKPIPYNLAIWFMEYSMLSSNIHFNCTMFIVDLIKSCSLSGKNAGTCICTFLCVLKERHTTQCWVSDYQSTRDMGNHLLHKFYAVPDRGIRTTVLRLWMFWIVLERLFLISAFWKETAHDCFEVHWFQLKCYLFTKAKIAGQQLLILTYFLKNSSYFERKW